MTASPSIEKQESTPNLTSGIKDHVAKAYPAGLLHRCRRADARVSFTPELVDKNDGGVTFERRFQFARPRRDRYVAIDIQPYNPGAGRIKTFQDPGEGAIAEGPFSDGIDVVLSDRNQHNPCICLLRLGQ